MSATTLELCCAMLADLFALRMDGAPPLASPFHEEALSLGRVWFGEARRFASDFVNDTRESGVAAGTVAVRRWRYDLLRLDTMKVGAEDGDWAVITIGTTSCRMGTCPPLDDDTIVDDASMLSRGSPGGGSRALASGARGADGPSSRSEAVVAALADASKRLFPL